LFIEFLFLQRQGRLSRVFGELVDQSQQSNQKYPSAARPLALQLESTSSNRESSDSIASEQQPAPQAPLSTVYKVDWSLAPRLIRVRIDCLRALKNKVLFFSF
jgi:hypothetical protein